MPSSGQAYESLRFISEQAMLGRFLRGMHYFGASAMVLLIGIHVSRTYIMAAYKFPRELNWLTGAVLLLLTLALAFTGQLLRWDQTAVWSVIVGAAQAARMPVVGEQIGRFILAGDTIGGATLSRFFAFHVFFIPAIVFAFIGLHLALVLRHGISERTRDGAVVEPATYRSHYASLLKREGVPFWPDAAWRDVVFGAAVTATIVLLALIVGPPDLGPPPDPSILEAYPRPDWYFLWYFALLALAPNNLESAIIVLGPLVFGAALLLVPLFNKGARSMRRRPWAPLLVVFIWTTIVIFWIAGERADWSPDFETRAAARLRHRRPAPGGRGGRPAVPREGLPVLPPDGGLRRPARARPLRGRQPDEARRDHGADHERRAQHAGVRADAYARPDPLADGVPLHPEAVSRPVRRRGSRLSEAELEDRPVRRRPAIPRRCPAKATAQ